MVQDRERGFTLIEAAVAIAVVAILSGIIVPLVVKNVRDSQIARARNDVQVIAGIIGTQYKDTGGRPSAAGVGGSTAAANQGWFSGTAVPVAGVGGTTTYVATNTFTNLFTSAPVPLAQTMFGLGLLVVATDEVAYKGPYMSQADALKTDPWGNPYIILGYNAGSQAVNGPIYVFSGGPDKLTVAANATNAVPPAVWNTDTTGADDLVARVN